jgi:serine/threonine-protein phosphatase 5
LFRHMDSPQRKPKRKVRGRGRRAARQDPESKSITLGSLDDLETARRSFLDPSGQGHSTILADVLWSDPCLESGFASNTARGIGLLWGPDCTEDFLVKNRLKVRGLLLNIY